MLFQKIKHLSVKKTRVKNLLAFTYPLHTTVRLVVNQKTNWSKTVDDGEHSYVFKVKDKDFYIPCDESFLVDSGATTHIVNYDSDFIFIVDNFNPEGHFIELADG